MKKIFTIFLFFVLFYQCYSQPPTYQLIIKNITLGDTLAGSGNMLKFNMFIQWTNQGSSDDFNYGSCQYCLTVNAAAMSGQTWAPKIIDSELPASLLPAATTNTASHQLRFSGNLPGPIFVVNNVFPGTKVLTVRYVTNLPSFPVVPLNLAWRDVGTGLITKISYLDPNGAGVFITNSASHFIDSTITPPPHLPPAPNFNADSTSIIAGGSVDFTDLTSYSPTSWSWSFPGGSPSSSNSQTPSRIFYNTPGKYPVSLFASNQYGNNTITKDSFVTVLPAPCTPTWYENLIVSDAGNGKDTLVFGIGPGATSCIDTCFGERIIPPPPPTGNFDTRFNLQCLDASKKDFRSDSLEITIWNLSFQPSSSGYPMTFKWDPTLLPNTGFFF